MDLVDEEYGLVIGVVEFCFGLFDDGMDVFYICVEG